MTTLPQSLASLYPFEQNTFRCSGGNMNYVDTRTGTRVVVLLHGNPTWSFLWRDLINALTKKGFRCIAPDHLGMGLSEKPNRYFTLAERIQHIEDLLAHLKIEKFSLCVHDWGGAIGCGIATNSPEKIERLVVTNTAAFLSKDIPLRIAFCKLAGIGPFLVKYFNLFAWPATFMSVCRKLPPAVKAGFLFPFRKCSDRSAVANFVRDIPLSPRHPSYARLKTIDESLFKLSDKPLLLVWGKKDFCFNLKFFNTWSERFPKAKKILIDNAGHYLFEDAGTQIIPSICEFLEQN